MVEAKQESDRLMCVKVEIAGVMLNVVSGYAIQVGCELEKKEKFWNELDGCADSIPREERVALGAALNGYVEDSM